MTKNKKKEFDNKFNRIEKLFWVLGFLGSLITFLGLLTYGARTGTNPDLASALGGMQPSSYLTDIALPLFVTSIFLMAAILLRKSADNAVSPWDLRLSTNGNRTIIVVLSLLTANLLYAVAKIYR